MEFHGEEARAVVWEHNTHIGDARATDMREEGMVNIGQLLREAHGSKVYAIGFGTYEGTGIGSAEITFLQLSPSGIIVLFISTVLRRCLRSLWSRSWNNFKNSTLVIISHIHRAINP